MRFISTRGGEACGFLHALARGRAPGGGLYLPQEWPQLTPEEMEAAGRKPLAETVEVLLLRFAGLELDPELARSATREAFTAFGHPAVAPLRELDLNLWLLDLARGPTLTGADIEMQVLAPIIDHAVAARGRSATMLLAASADDGPAAVEAFRDRAGVGLVVLFPAEGVTPAQRRALTDSSAGNVRAVEVAGGADDCRALVAAALADEQLVQDTALGSIGPENIGRMLVASAILLAAACRLGAPDRTVTLAAPAGDGALSSAAHALAEMGVPLGRTVVAEGPGGLLRNALDGARYGAGMNSAASSWAEQPNWPPAFERLYFEATGRHVLETARAARAYGCAGSIDLAPAVRSQLGRRLQSAIVAPAEAAATAMAARNAEERLDIASAAVLAVARRFVAEGGQPVISPLLAHPAWTSESEVGGAGDPLAELPTVRRSAGQARCDHLAADPQALGAYLRAFAGLSRAA